MKAKDFLKQLKKLDKLIENKLIEKSQWKAMALNTTSRLSPDKVQSSGSQQKMADAVNRCIDIEKEIDQYVDKLVDTKKDVISVIEQLSATEYDICHKIYVQYFTLQEVGDYYNRSYNWATTIHGRALKNVQKILNERK